MRRDRGLLPVIGAGTLTAACGVGLLATSGWLITRASQRPAVLSLSIAIGAVQAFPWAGAWRVTWSASLSMAFRCVCSAG